MMVQKLKLQVGIVLKASLNMLIDRLLCVVLILCGNNIAKSLWFTSYLINQKWASSLINTVCKVRIKVLFILHVISLFLGRKFLHF